MGNAFLKEEDVIALAIKLNSKDAIAGLKDFTRGLTDYEQVAGRLGKVIEATMAQTGLSFDKAKDKVLKLNNEMLRLAGTSREMRGKIGLELSGRITSPEGYAPSKSSASAERQALNTELLQKKVAEYGRVAEDAHNKATAAINKENAATDLLKRKKDEVGARIKKLEEERRVLETKREGMTQKQADEHAKNLVKIDQEIAKLELLKKKLDDIDARRAKTSEQAKVQDVWNAKIKEGTDAVGGLIRSLNIDPSAKSFSSNIATLETAIKNFANTAKVDVGTAATEIKKQFRGMVDSDQVNKALDNVRAGMMTFGDHVKNIFGKVKTYIQTAFGTLTAMVLFAALARVQQFFADATQAAKEFRAEAAKLQLAESLLSKKGMDITLKELDGFIEQLQDKYKFISEMEVGKILSDVALTTKEFGLTKEQLLQMADAIVYVKLQASLMGKEVADVSQITNAILDGNVKTLNTMGINISEQLIQREAIKMGLMEEGDEMTRHVKLMAELNLLTSQSSDNAAELIATLSRTPEGLRLLASIDYKEFSKEVGGVWYDIETSLLTSYQAAKNLSAILDDWSKKSPDAESTIGAIRGILDSVWVFDEVIASIMAAGAAVASFFGFFLVAINEYINGKTLRESFEKAGFEAGKVFVEGMTSALRAGLKDRQGTGNVFADWTRNAWMRVTGQDIYAEPPPEIPDTPKGESPQDPNDLLGLPNDGEIEDEGEKIAKAILDVQQKIDEALLDLEQDKAEAKIDLDIKFDDIRIDYQNKVADALRDYQNKIADINADANQQIADAQDDARDDELKDEQEFQNKLLEMKEKFLFDLEDALHERDARQILRLIRQYNLEKQQAIRDHELKKQQRDDDLKDELEDIERQRQQKLADAAIAYQRELEEANLWRKREEEEARRDYQRKLAELDRHFADKIAKLISFIGYDYNLTVAGAQAVYDALQAYYGSNGKILTLMNAYYAQMKANAAAHAAAMGATPTSDPSATTPTPAGGWGGVSGNATGGTTTTPPTTSGGRVGDDWWNKPGGIKGGKGFEAFGTSTFMPRVSSSLSSAAGLGGNIELMVTLSQDLEARIVGTSLEQVALTIDRVTRERR